MIGTQLASAASRASSRLVVGRCYGFDPAQMHETAARGGVNAATLATRDAGLTDIYFGG